jgi:hypothetical protein
LAHGFPVENPYALVEARPENVQASRPLRSREPE